MPGDCAQSADDGVSQAGEDLHGPRDCAGDALRTKQGESLGDQLPHNERGNGDTVTTTLSAKGSA